MRAIYETANKADSAAEKEMILKEYRLWDVKVWLPKLIIDT